MSAETGSNEAVARAESISVLYVDDYPELCELAETSLDEASDAIEVTTTTEPGAVTDRLEEADCIVADYRMPGTDGLELLRRVRVVDEEIPFILHTGEGSENVASEAISLGVTDYLTKGGGQEKFKRMANRIEDAVRARRANRVVERTRSRAQATVERERARFQALVEHSPTSTVVLDESGRFRYATPSFEDITGFKPRELDGEVAFDRVHEADRDRVREEFHRAIEDPAYQPRVEYRYRHRNGEFRHLESKGTNRLADPDIEGFVINIRDVTDRERTRAELGRERAVAEGLLGVSDTPLFVADREGYFRRSNRAVAEAFGVAPAELSGLSPAVPGVEVRTPGGDPVPPEEFLVRTVIDTGRPWEGVEYRLTVAGRAFEVVASAAPVESDPAAAVVGLDEVAPTDNNT